MTAATSGGGGGRYDQERNPGFVLDEEPGKGPEKRSRVWNEKDDKPPKDFAVFREEAPSNVFHLPVAPPARPKTRAECAEVPRPCPFVGCVYNTYLDVTPQGSILIYRPELSPDEVDPARSCVLDIAETEGEQTLEEIGEVFDLSRERVRQVEEGALRVRARLAAYAQGITRDDAFFPRAPDGSIGHDSSDDEEEGRAEEPGQSEPRLRTAYSYPARPARALHMLKISDEETSDEEYAAALFAIYERERGNKEET